MAQQSVQQCSGCQWCNHGFNGAGVCLMIKKHLADGTDKLCILAVSDTNIAKSKGFTLLYDVVGGKLDIDSKTGNRERCSDCVSREMAEETHGVFRMSSDDIRKHPFVDIPLPSGKHMFRVYVIVLKPMDGVCTLFHKNMKADMKNPNLPSCWKETTAMAYFPLKGITFSDGIHTDPIQTPLTGKTLITGLPQQISSRMQNFLQHLCLDKQYSALYAQLLSL
jgi:hypothetical protein